MSRYLESCQSAFWKKVFAREVEYVRRELKGRKTILSVGCGPAIVERALAEGGFDVTGLDVSEEALEGVPDNVRAVVGPAEEMGFEGDSFDAAIYVASLQFVDDYEKAIRETRRVIRPGGKFVALLLNPSSLFFRSKRRRAASYVNKIKHPAVAPIEMAVRKNFSSVSTRFLLGIGKSNRVFESSNPDFAALYSISGIKPRS